MVNSGLREAIFHGDVERTKALVEGTPAALDVPIQGGSHYTPLAFAISRQQMEVAKLLLKQKNVDPTKTDKHGYNAIFSAFVAGSAYCQLIVEYYAKRGVPAERVAQMMRPNIGVTALTLTP